MPTIVYEDANVQIVETITPNGKTVQTIYKPGSPSANLETLLGRADAALAANRAYLQHVAIPVGTLTAAQLSTISRTLSDQIDALTRQVNALIRITRGQLDSVTDA